MYYATYEEVEYLAEQNSIEASQEFTDMVKDNGDLRGETVVFDNTQIWKI